MLLRNCSCTATLRTRRWYGLVFDALSRCHWRVNWSMVGFSARDTPMPSGLSKSPARLHTSASAPRRQPLIDQSISQWRLFHRYAPKAQISPCSSRPVFEAMPAAGSRFHQPNRIYTVVVSPKLLRPFASLPYGVRLMMASTPQRTP